MRYLTALILFAGLFFTGLFSSSVNLSQLENDAVLIEEFADSDHAFSRKEGNGFMEPLNQDLGVVRTNATCGWCRILSSPAPTLLRLNSQQKTCFSREFLRMHTLGCRTVPCHAIEIYSSNPIFNCSYSVMHYVYGMRKILI